MPVTFIDPLDEDLFRKEVKIYRIYTLDRLLEMFQQEKFTFLSPSKWKDPYEKRFLTLNITDNEQQMLIPTVPQGDPLNYNLYAQCWTGLQESEAFWRVRSPNNDGINITVKTNDLYHFLDARPENIYIGKVKYLSLTKIFDPNEIRNELLLSGGDNLLFHLRLLLRKRRAYRYEKEYRIFLLSDQATIAEVYDILNFNPCQIIYRLMLHPDMGEHLVTLLTNYFNGHCINNIRINKSNFSAPVPPINLTI